MKYKKYKKGDTVIITWSKQVGIIGEFINDTYVINFIKTHPGESTYTILHAKNFKSYINIGEQLLFEFMKE